MSKKKCVYCDQLPPAEPFDSCGNCIVIVGKLREFVATPKGRAFVIEALGVKIDDDAEQGREDCCAYFKFDDDDYTSNPCRKTNPERMCQYLGGEECLGPDHETCPLPVLVEKAT